MPLFQLSRAHGQQHMIQVIFGLGYRQQQCCRSSNPHPDLRQHPFALEGLLHNLSQGSIFFHRSHKVAPRCAAQCLVQCFSCCCGCCHGRCEMLERGVGIWICLERHTYIFSIPHTGSHARHPLRTHDLIRRSICRSVGRVPLLTTHEGLHYCRALSTCSPLPRALFAPITTLSAGVPVLRSKYGGRTL